MTEDELARQCQRIHARLRTERWTPMMRFDFLNWTHADYETLDTLLGASAVPTRRRVLPEDDGILVGCGIERTPPYAADLEPSRSPGLSGAHPGRAIQHEPSARRGI